MEISIDGEHSKIVFISLCYIIKSQSAINSICISIISSNFFINKSIMIKHDVKFMRPTSCYLTCA